MVRGCGDCGRRVSSSAALNRPARWGIDTLEGWFDVTPGDWIITGVNGERYPCKPDIFEKTYEAVEQ